MSSYLRSSIHTALLATALAGGVASAAEPQQTTFIEEIEVIVVTGSYIEGAAEDAALPIDVLRAEDLAKQGSPSMVELIKQIPAMQGVVGESNQFTAANTSGTANVNLRGLGGVRTLVLMNGRRLVQSPAGTIGYDVNLLPTAAMGRIEILKDGAAATYGSDAVAGVVNFITKRGYEGLNLEGAYNYVDGSDGDYSANALWGTKGEDWDLLVAGAYRHRSELSATDRDFALRPITENPNGGYSGFGNPGTIQFLNAAGNTATGSIRDPGCAATGNLETGTTGCTFQFTAFDNLVEREEHYNVYAEFNKLFGEDTEFHVEAMYAVHETPEENSSPSYAPTLGATLDANGNLTAPNFFIPLNNPGMTAALRSTIQSQLTGPALAAFNNAGGYRVSGLSWRPFGASGNPITGEGKEDERNFDAYRISTSLKGQTDIFGWDVAVTFMETTREIITPDIVTTRLQAALSGFGGPNCTGTTPGAGGCLWLNPFSTAVQMNPATGVVNNGGLFDASTVNTAELAGWLFQNNQFEDTASTFVVDAVLNGQLPFGFSAGEIGWAAGAQFREETLERDPNDLTDVTKNPCVNSLSTGNMNCAVQSGVFSFIGPSSPLDLSRDISAVFTEFNIPVLDSLSVQAAFRYEDYGGSVGATTNPKLSVRWQALDSLTFRGSVGTTFRGPQQTQLAPQTATVLAFIPAAGGYKSIDNSGNPDLKPEEALTFNVGAIFKAGAFSASVDYWSYDFEDSLEAESGSEMAARFLTAPNACTDPTLAGLRSRFLFQGGICANANGTVAVQNLIKINTNTINGPDQKLSGIDASVSYLFDDVLLGGDILVGADGTYTLEYERDASFVEGIQIQAAGDFAGTRGASGIGAGSLPEIRGGVYFDFSRENQGLRLTARYVDGVKDIRAGLATASPFGVDIGSFLTYDAVYRLSLPQETTITASVINLTDRDPPLARLDLSYDPFIANPYGRYFKLLLNKKF